jgi:hypothetical protein
MFPCFTRDIQRTLLWVHRKSSFRLIRTGLSPSMVLRSSRVLIVRLRGIRAQQHHISTPFLERIQFALCRFRSPLLTASRLISFPAVTRMFRSTAFPTITGHSEEYEVIFSNHRIIGFLHLPGAYRSLTRPSSALEPSHSPIGVASRSLILSA